MRRVVVAIAAGALSILAASARPAAAVTFKVDVEYTTENDCVKEIKVVPRGESCAQVNAATPKDVCIDPQGHWGRNQDTHVLWLLKPVSGGSPGEVTWWVEWKESDPAGYKHCSTDKNEMKKAWFAGKVKFKCKFQNTGENDEGFWDYIVRADDACDTATLDPQIVFADGGGEPGN